ncbi:MAG: 5-formyltetrahydrofolate cyclo-ligase [Lachnospiraceae bacterium]|nr:5-formyltetrahydrofolate cyclo-ligase [Lachnospiraceae bacterium]
MNQSIVMTKQELRNRYLQRRNDLSVRERKEKSIQVLQNLKKLPEFQKAEEVLIYLNYRSEVETLPFVEELLQQKEKRVFVPKVCGMDIRFYEIISMEDVESGYQGILEPKEGMIEFSVQKPDGKNCIMVLPGSVFDRKCNRMGYGKGFYDRFMKLVPQMYGAGLAFDCQVAPAIPIQAHDYRMNALITESGCYFKE